ncbi:hypothetical protein HMPREF2637_09465 [Streptococcus sp. HMSC065H07]|nr:hypothetical protein HMPREF2637_09465 [Streptococcus sp. HMSC065H07]
MRFSVKKIDKSKRLHYTKSVKKIRIHQGGKSHGESQYFKVQKRRLRSLNKTVGKTITLPFISEERDRMTVGRYKNGD